MLFLYQPEQVQTKTAADITLQTPFSIHQITDNFQNPIISHLTPTEIVIRKSDFSSHHL